MGDNFCFKFPGTTTTGCRMYEVCACVAKGQQASHDMSTGCRLQRTDTLWLVSCGVGTSDSEWWSSMLQAPEGSAAASMAYALSERSTQHGWLMQVVMRPFA